MNTILKAITYQFEQKNWQETLGYLFLAFLVVGLISLFISFSIQLPVEIMLSYFREMGKAMPAGESISSLVSSGTNALRIPVILYLMGYLFEVVGNVVGQKEKLFPTHGDFFNRLVNGFKLWAINFIALLPTTILALLVIGSIAFATFLAFSAASKSIFMLLLGLALCLLFVIVVIVFSVVNGLITFTSWYIYIKTSTFSKAISYGLIIKSIRTNERILLKGYLYLLGLQFVQAFVGFMSLFMICLVFFSGPIIMLVGYFAKAYIFALTYQKMSKLEA
ncbi:DUF4013 domain-containing protein [bacterium]|nr:DUF4013 domain-containing protein [bacterium]